jgi:hypothetical protein
MKKVMSGPTMSMREFEKRADQILAELQKTLMPEHASRVIGNNVDTGEYVLPPEEHEAWTTSHENQRTRNEPADRGSNVQKF